MIDSIEALIALHEKGTMGKAALVLHVTQSAVSKRIENLENIFKKPLIEKNGRRVRLTPAGIRFVEKSRPLLAEIKNALLDEHIEGQGKIVVDVSVSVLISWGANVLGRIRKKLNLDLEVHAHHASVAVERVRSGESNLAIVQGGKEIAPDLITIPVIDDPVAIVPSGLKKFKFPKSGDSLELLCIESHTEAWRFLNRGLNIIKAKTGVKFEVCAELEGFSAITELAKAGFGHGLVPVGVAKALGVKESQLVLFPTPGIFIPVSLFARKSTLARPLVDKFQKMLIEEVNKI